MKITEKYFVKHESKESKPGYCNVLEVSIFQKNEDETEVKIGGYTRNYHTFYKTFWPFEQKGKEYALISRDYTCLEVIELPSCKTIASEEPHTFGFCPVELYVPPEEMTKYDDAHLDGTLGFVAGCVWGDDSSWKIRPIDLRRIEEGKVETLDSFGYLEMPDDGGYFNSIEKCLDSISVTESEDGRLRCWVTIAGTKQYTVFADNKDRILYNKEKSIQSLAYYVISAGLVDKSKQKELEAALSIGKRLLCDSQPLLDEDYD